MTIFKSTEYICICNVDNVKVIVWICTDSKLIWQSKLNKYLSKTRKTNKVAQRRRTNQCRDKTTKSQNKKRKIDVKITYFNKSGREKMS